MVLEDGRTYELDKEIFTFYRLKEGVEIPEEQFTRVLQQSGEKLAKDYALDFLGNRARSETEVRDRLKIKKIRQEYIDKAVEDLKRTGLIDDKLYAARYCRDMLERKPMGPYLLRLELKKRGITEEIAGETIDKFYEENPPASLAERAVRKKPQLIRIRDEHERKRKIYDFLMRRGFGYDEIGESLAVIEKERDETH